MGNQAPKSRATRSVPVAPRRQPKPIGYWVDTAPKHSDIFTMQVSDDLSGGIHVEVVDKHDSVMKFFMRRSEFQSMVDAARLCGMAIK